MSDGSRAPATKAAVALALLIAGVLLAALYRLVSGTESHAYAVGGQPPGVVSVTSEQTYELSVPGGVEAALHRGIGEIPAQDGGTARLALTCSWSTHGSAAQALALTAERIDTKAINGVASFTAPLTGQIHVDCTGLGAMFIDDGDSSPADVAGWFLLFAVISLTLGAGLGLSVLRSWFASRAGGQDTSEPGEDDSLQYAPSHARGDEEWQ